MQDLVGEDRHQHGVGHADQADQADQKQQRPDYFCFVGPAEPLDDVFDGGIFPGAVHAAHVHQQQADDHRHIADGIYSEARSLANLGDQDCRYSRAHNARAVEHGRIERDGVHQVILANHVDKEGLAPWDVEGVHHAEQGCQDENVRYMDAVGEGKPGQDCCQNHGCGLSSNDQAVAVDPIHDSTAEGCQQKNGNLAGETDRAQQQRRFRQAVDEPRLGHALHPRTGEGDELPAEEKLEVTVTQGAQGHRPFGLRRAFGFCSFWDCNGVRRLSGTFRTLAQIYDEGNRAKDAAGGRCDRERRAICCLPGAHISTGRESHQLETSTRGRSRIEY